MKKIFLPVFCFLTITNTTKAQENDTTISHQEIIVTGVREAVDSKYLPLSITQISNKELERNYNLSVIPTIVEQTPGLFATSRGIIGYGLSTNSAGGIKVRGVGSGAQLLVLIDGQPQYAGLMGHPIADAYQSFSTEKVEIVRGPASVLYGSNAMGGVVNIITKDGLKTNGSKVDVSVSGGSYGTFITQGNLKARQGKFSTALGVSYQKTDGHRDNSNFKQLTDFIKLGYDFNEHWTINADLNLTNFQFSNPGPENAPIFDSDADIVRGLTSISVSNKYANTSGSFRVFYDWGEHEINDGHLISAAPKDYLYKHKDYIGGILWYQTNNFKSTKLTYGIDYQNFGGKAWNDFFDGKTVDLVKDKNQDELAGYLTVNQGITDWLKADLGIRVDNHSQVGTEIVPQFGLTFFSQHNDNVKLLVSKGFRNPIIREMYMFVPQNENLEPERMWNYEISYSKQIKNLKIEADIFFIDGENLITTVPKTDGGGMINKNIGDFQNKGFEMSAKYFLHYWNFLLNYSFLNMETPVDGAPEHKICFNAGYNNEKFSANLTLEQISGLYISTGSNEEKENYTLLNLNIGYKPLSFLKVFVKADNLLAQKYQTYSGFYMPKATFIGGICFNF